MEKKPKNKKFILILIVLVLFGGTYGTYKYLHSLSHEGTDDAQIEKNMNPIIPRVVGYITKVYVKDNDFVKKGVTFTQIRLNRDLLSWNMSFNWSPFGQSYWGFFIGIKAGVLKDIKWDKRTQPDRTLR